MPHWSSTRCLAAISPGTGGQQASVIGLTIPVCFQFLLRVFCAFLIILLAPPGPLLTYLASCGSTTCDSFDARTAKWFKIDQVAKDSNGAWVQQQISEFLSTFSRMRLASCLHTVDGNVYSANLPKNLAAGEYLVRHEIIALHLATQKGGAEFYPSCQQIKVGGSGTGVPTKDELLSFPGAYSDDDPGIYTPNVSSSCDLIDLSSDVWDIQVFDPNSDYVFPGGPIAKLVASSGGGNDDGTSTSISLSSTRKPSSTTSVTSPAVPTGTGDPATDGSPTCSLKNDRSLLKRSNWKSRRSDHHTRPHRVSRIMRKMVRGNSW